MIPTKTQLKAEAYATGRVRHRIVGSGMQDADLVALAQYTKIADYFTANPERLSNPKNIAYVAVVVNEVRGLPVSEPRNTLIEKINELLGKADPTIYRNCKDFLEVANMATGTVK